MKVLNYVGAYLLWFINSLFGLWLCVLSRNTWLSAFSRYYIQESPTREQRAGFMDKVLVLIFGFAWLIMVIINEANFRKGVEKKDLFRRFARATGPLVLAIFVIDVVLALIQGFVGTSWIRVVIFLVELVLGILLVRVGQRKATTNKPDEISDFEANSQHE